MLSAFRAWSAQHLAFLRPQSGDQSRRTDEMNRESRIHVVDALREDIHRIQHEISVLHGDMSGDVVPVTTAQKTHMADLHRALASKQQELGKYQARV